MTAKWIRCVAAACSLLVSGGIVWGTAFAAAPENDLEAAERLAAAGDWPRAEAAYERLLATHPGNVGALLGRAHARSFQRKLTEAQADFQSVLDADPENIAALVGLGYSFAWTGRFREAEHRFLRALAVTPGQPDATKGLAYVALWRGDPREATRRFEIAARQTASNAEIQVGLGQSLYADGRRREARVAFARALEIEPGRVDAREGLAATQPVGPQVELTVLGGLTDFGGRRETGIRFAEAGLAPFDGARFWLQYDDTLSLDNVGLARAGTHAPSLYAGGLVHYGERYASRLEGGWRRLEGGLGQAMLRGEQIFDLEEALALKVGGWLGLRSDRRLEAIAHAGIAIPFGERLRLEPALFYARTGHAGEHDIRGLVTGEYGSTSGWRLGGGVGVGRSLRPAPAADGTPVNVFAQASFPLGRLLDGRLFASREWPAQGSALTVLAIGLAGRFGGSR